MSSKVQHTQRYFFFFCVLHNASISWGLFSAFSNCFQQSWWVSHIEVKYTNVCALFNTTSPILLLLLFRNLNLFPFRQFYWPLKGLYACFMMLHLCPFCLPTDDCTEQTCFYAVLWKSNVAQPWIGWMLIGWQPSQKRKGSNSSPGSVKAWKKPSRVKTYSIRSTHSVVDIFHRF